MAENLLIEFVAKYVQFYGDDRISYNVHSLIHLVEDVKKLGPLDIFSAFPFESKLYEIKNLLRSGNKPLKQCAHRLIERNTTEFEKNMSKQLYPILKRKMDDTFHEVPECIGVYNKIVFKNFCLTNKSRDGWILTTTKTIVKIINFTRKHAARYHLFVWCKS